MSEKVTMIELLHLSDGTLSLGNSVEMTIKEGIKAIEQGSHCSDVASIGVIPSAWGVVDREVKKDGRSS